MHNFQNRRGSATEYHLIDTINGRSLGGFISLEGAREHAQEEMLATWEIWRGNIRIEMHAQPLYEFDDLLREIAAVESLALAGRKPA